MDQRKIYPFIINLFQLLIVWIQFQQFYERDLSNGIIKSSWYHNYEYIMNIQLYHFDYLTFQTSGVRSIYCSCWTP